MKRRLPLAIALLLGAAACGTVDPPAATVNGQEINLREFEADFEALFKLQEKGADEAAKAAALQDPTAPTTTGPKSATASSAAAGQLLNNYILLSIMDIEAKARKLTPTANDEQSAANVELQVVGLDKAGYALLPARMRARLHGMTSSYVALNESMKLPAVDDAGLEALYTAQKAKGSLPEDVCAAHILVPTEAEANNALAQIAAGKSFADVAKAMSTDTGSGAQGGNLVGDDGVCPTADQLVPEFVAGAREATVGRPSKPVQSEFGFHVIQLAKPVGPASFESIKPQLAETAERDRFAPFPEWLKQATTSAKVTVDPRFGTWDPTKGQITPNDTGEPAAP